MRLILKNSSKEEIDTDRREVEVNVYVELQGDTVNEVLKNVGEDIISLQEENRECDDNKKIHNNYNVDDNKNKDNNISESEGITNDDHSEQIKDNKNQNKQQNKDDYKEQSKEQSKEDVNMISLPTMHMVFFAGLRGAVAFACANIFPDTNGNR